MTRIAVLSLGREQGMGEVRRVASWRAIGEAAGAEVIVVPLLRDHRVGITRRPSPLAALTGASALEALSWSPASVRQSLGAMEPTLVVAVTARAWHPSLSGTAPSVVLDFVDRLSVSYRDRAAVDGDVVRRAAWRALARRHDHFESSVARRSKLMLVAAGRGDAAAMGIDWVPNTLVAGQVHDESAATHDLLFFGNLSYAPNVSALGSLDDLWPELTTLRPNISMLVAGAHPGPRVLELAHRRGWAVEVDFSDVATLAPRARVAVAPLLRASGIQNKVLEAAAHGMPQVISPAAAAGVDDEFPALVAEVGPAFARAAVELIESTSRRAALGGSAGDHPPRRYSPQAWAPWVSTLVGQPAR